MGDPGVLQLSVFATKLSEKVAKAAILDDETLKNVVNETAEAADLAFDDDLPTSASNWMRAADGFLLVFGRKVEFEGEMKQQRTLFREEGEKWRQNYQYAPQPSHRPRAPDDRRQRPGPYDNPNGGPGYGRHNNPHNYDNNNTFQYNGTPAMKAYRDGGGRRFCDRWLRAPLVNGNKPASCGIRNCKFDHRGSSDELREYCKARGGFQDAIIPPGFGNQNHLNANDDPFAPRKP